GQAAVFASMPHRDSDESGLGTLLHAAGRLWLAGMEVDWRAFQRGQRRRVPLPTYPFQLQRFWIERPGIERPGIERPGIDRPAEVTAPASGPIAAGPVAAAGHARPVPD